MDPPRSDLLRGEWFKSSRSGSEGCVEIAFVHGGVAVRDSKDRGGSILLFTPAEWEAFIGGVRNGEFEITSPS